MQNFARCFRSPGLFSLSLLLLGLLLLPGCGGGGSGPDPSSSVPVGADAPNTLTGGVIVMSYSDGRTFTFTFNSTAGTGVTRSDGKTTTGWAASGYGTPQLVMSLAYGAIDTTNTPSTTVYDSYQLVFTTVTTGTMYVQENVTASTINTGKIISGTFKFTTYPSNG
ncbi:MAG: hypothetical protein ACHQ4G_00660 [Opitutales bacterium]